MDRNVHFQFQGQASLFSEKSSPKRDVLTLTADEHVTRSILATAPLKDHNHAEYRKPDFMFRDTAPDIDQ